MVVLCPSAKALQIVLARGGVTAEKIRTRFARPIRWRWLNGSRRADLASAIALHAITSGEVSVWGWYTEEERAAYLAGAEQAEQPTAGAA